jgi:hypothetical protein
METMKVWSGYSSEHSANLVMIGKFKSGQDANETNELLRKLIEQAGGDQHAGLINVQGQTERFSDGMMKLLSNANIYVLAPSELEQFNYEHDIRVEGGSVVVRTDEIDVSALLKVLIMRGARVEVYSAHDHP